MENTNKFNGNNSREIFWKKFKEKSWKTHEITENLRKTYCNSKNRFPLSINRYILNGHFPKIFLKFSIENIKFLIFHRFHEISGKFQRKTIQICRL